MSQVSRPYAELTFFEMLPLQFQSDDFVYFHNIGNLAHFLSMKKKACSDIYLVKKFTTNETSTCSIFTEIASKHGSLTVSPKTHRLSQLVGQLVYTPSVEHTTPLRLLAGTINISSQHFLLLILTIRK